MASQVMLLWAGNATFWRYTDLRLGHWTVSNGRGSGPGWFPPVGSALDADAYAFLPGMPQRRSTSLFQASASRIVSAVSFTLHRRFFAVRQNVSIATGVAGAVVQPTRSEERRVGKEW